MIHELRVHDIDVGPINTQITCMAPPSSENILREKKKSFSSTVLKDFGPHRLFQRTHIGKSEKLKPCALPLNPFTNVWKMC